MALDICFGIFDQLKYCVSIQLYYAFVYSNMNYGIGVHGSCFDT